MERKYRRVVTKVEGPSRTKQSFRDECDINGIMKKFEKTGLLEHVNEHRGDYGDFTDVPQNYHEALSQVVAAEQMFMTLPAKVRARFRNDPGEFLAAVDSADPAVQGELVRLGLAELPPGAELAPDGSLKKREEEISPGDAAFAAPTSSS